jgi:hypothetical protein
MRRVAQTRGHSASAGDHARRRECKDFKLCRQPDLRLLDHPDTRKKIENDPHSSGMPGRKFFVSIHRCSSRHALFPGDNQGTLGNERITTRDSLTRALLCSVLRNLSVSNLL